MTLTSSLLTFTLAATLMAMTPGVDTALVLRTALFDNLRAAVQAALGVVSGCLLWGLAVAVGLGALLTSYPIAFTGLQWAGAAYLVALGVLQWRHARPDPSQLAPPQPSALGLNSSYSQGLLTNVLNPKVGLFYLTFLPQFIPPAITSAWYLLLLACIHALISVLWLVGVALASQTVRAWLARPRTQTAMHRCTAMLFIGFGMKLAWSRL